MYECISIHFYKPIDAQHNRNLKLQITRLFRMYILNNFLMSIINKCKIKMRKLYSFIFHSQKSVNIVDLQATVRWIKQRVSRVSVGAFTVTIQILTRLDV